jgi:hypothetical protein
MFNERFAIQQRMQEIRQERRELHDEYYKLFDRLRDLDKDTAGVDMTNLAIELTKAVQTISSFVPPITVHEVIERVRREHQADDLVILTDKSPINETQHRVGIAAQQAITDGVSSLRPRLKKLAINDAISKIVTMLREEGEMAPKEITKQLNEAGYYCKTSIHELLRKARDVGKTHNSGFGKWKAVEQEMEREEEQVAEYEATEEKEAL